MVRFQSFNFGFYEMCESTMQRSFFSISEGIVDMTIVSKIDLGVWYDHHKIRSSCIQTCIWHSTLMGTVERCLLRMMMGKGLLVHTLIPHIGHNKYDSGSRTGGAVIVPTACSLGVWSSEDVWLRLLHWVSEALCLLGHQCCHTVLLRDPKAKWVSFLVSRTSQF